MVGQTKSLVRVRTQDALRHFTAFLGGGALAVFLGWLSTSSLDTGAGGAAGIMFLFSLAFVWIALSSFASGLKATEHVCKIR